MHWESDIYGLLKHPVFRIGPARPTLASDVIGGLQPLKKRGYKTRTCALCKSEIAPDSEKCGVCHSRTPLGFLTLKGDRDQRRRGYNAHSHYNEKLDEPDIEIKLK